VVRLLPGRHRRNNRKQDLGRPEKRLPNIQLAKRSCLAGKRSTQTESRANTPLRKTTNASPRNELLSRRTMTGKLQRAQKVRQKLFCFPFQLRILSRLSRFSITTHQSPFTSPLCVLAFSLHCSSTSELLNSFFVLRLLCLFAAITFPPQLSALICG